MYSIVSTSGQILRGPTNLPEPVAHKGLWVPHVIDAMPVLGATQIAYAGALTVDFVDGLPVGTRQGWIVREKISSGAARQQQITDTIVDLSLAVANWGTLSAANQKAVLLRLTQVILILLKERLVNTDLPL